MGTFFIANRKREKSTTFSYRPAPYGVLWLFIVAFGGLFFLSCEETKPVVKQFTIIFNTNGGSTVSTQTINSGQTVTEPKDPIRLNHIFGGWYKENTFATAFNFPTEVITANITLYAKWTLKMYSVSFNTNDGSAVQEQIVSHGNKATKPTPDPTKASFIFEDWYKTQSSTTPFDFSTETITSDITLYAKWRTATSEGRITAFSFSKRFNPEMSLHEDENIASGTIDPTAGTITVSASAYIYIENLKKPSFTTSTGATVRVGTTTQESEFTQNDFTQPVTYRVTSEDGIITKDYVVKVARNNFASIPDDNFRSELKRLLPDAFGDDDKLNTAHNSVADFTGFNYGSSTNFIKSMKGVEFLTALTSLEVRTDALGDIDVSRNVHLNSLQVYSAQSGKLKVLDLFENTALTSLGCSNNQLTALNLSENTALTDLVCSNNQLTALNLSKNTALTSLGCYENRLRALDLSKNTALTDVYCNINRLEALDLSKNITLTSLNCSDNRLEALDITGMRSVRFLKIDSDTDKNPLTTLKVFDDDAIKQDAEVKKIKTDRDDAMTISTYSYDIATSTYTETCANYDPNADAGSRCP